MSDAPTTPPTGEPRARLLDGMARVVRDGGLRGATVADVVRHARVSRRTFYEHFGDLAECYLALMDDVGELMLSRAREAVTGAGTVQERIERAVSGYLGMLEEDPALSRSYWLEFHLTGDKGLASAVAAAARNAELFHALAVELRADDPDLGPLPPEATLMLLGGIRELAMHLAETGRAPAEVRPTMVWMVRLVATARGPGPADAPGTSA